MDSDAGRGKGMVVASDVPEWLLSLPPAMTESARRGVGGLESSTFVTCDPPGRPLGSGGGTAHLLTEGWKAHGGGASFTDWLRASPKVVLHGGGQSRRLPSYAAVGKPFIPVPAYRWSMGQRMDQTLLDLQRPFVNRVMAQGAKSARLAIVSGDVLLRSDGALPPLPDADVVMLGLWARPEEAQHFGVLFCDPRQPGRMMFFLQKPSPDRIRELAADYLFMIDVGIWVLSEKAVMCLLGQCGWDPQRECFAGGVAGVYDLYGQWGPMFGEKPLADIPGKPPLTCAVACIPQGEFYHFGKSQDVIDSTYALQNLVVDQTRFPGRSGQSHPRQFIQNSDFRFPLRQELNHSLWVENAMVPATWALAARHVITNIPDNDWSVVLREGLCLDMPPMGDSGHAIRPYGIEDPFRGALGDSATVWMGRPFGEWLSARGLTLAEAGFDPAVDIQEAALFPVLGAAGLDSGFINWICAEIPAASDTYRTRWLRAPRVSASGIGQDLNLERMYASRRQRMQRALLAMAANYRRSVFFRLDLAHAASVLAAESPALPELQAGDPPVLRMHERMLRARVASLQGDPDGAADYERAAFGVLRDAIVAPVMANAVIPGCTVLADQIVWGRSPARLDLAGGWTDTPPYCLECGGAVLNMAVLLNGQPPVQVFARLIEERSLVIRSIDLGLSEELRTYGDVAAYSRLNSGFAVARAAFALAGFHPDFNGHAFASLKEQLDAFGGGVEVSMLAAIPKGSGLGTSSILAATLLGTLADLGGLGWDRPEIARRTLALEQMLTSGGGWQDQVGGLFHGIKLVETRPGLEQVPLVRWAPSAFFEQPDIRRRTLLYYTGVTRVARNILSEIVRGIFLNSRASLDILDRIGQNARHMYEAILRNDADGVAEGIRASWNLNQQLDAGTSVPDVEAILAGAGSDLAAAKLAGAGGGGYLFMIATDEAAAGRIRERLRLCPPNPRARFVDYSVSEDGLQITRS